MDRLFVRLAAEFGHKWNSQFPTQEAQEVSQNLWAERLAGLTMDEVKHGVDKLSGYATRNDGWPPGAAEFKVLCKPHRETYERVEFQQRALPHKPAPRAKAMRYIKQLRGELDER